MSDRRQPVTHRKNVGGRPKASEPRSTVCTWVPARTHDRLLEAAKAHRMSLSAYVRRVVILTLDGGVS